MILILRMRPQEKECQPINKPVTRKKVILRKMHKNPQENIQS